MVHVVILVIGVTFVGLVFLVVVLCQPPTMGDDCQWPHDEDFST